MRPQDNQQPQPTVHVPQREGYSLVSSRPNPANPAPPASPNRAAADIARQQLRSIYQADDSNMMEVADPQVEPAVSEANQPTTPQAVTPVDSQPATLPNQANPSSSQDLAIENPYERTMDDTDLKASATNWQQYHSAWQQYYQQYFHRYYSAEIQKAKAQAAGQATAPTTANGQSVDRGQAMRDIRSRLRASVEERAKKVRRSRHFVPLAAAFGVMLVFTFLQYNSVLFSNIQAYVTPGDIEPANIIVDPRARSAVSPDPLLVIPKINVQVPVVWDVKPDHDSQMKAMEEGVAWFGIPGANSKPGQIGNTVLSGHSSNDFFETGKYKFVFAPLEKLEADDAIEIHYKGTLYRYVVTKKEVVLPTEVDKLIYDTDKPMLTLITCTPLGTALKRLLVTAEQVSPSPSKAKPAPASSGSGQSVEMPGSEPTLIERMFGG